MTNAIQKLNYKVSYKLPIFLIVILTFLGQLSLNPINSFVSCCSLSTLHKRNLGRDVHPKLKQAHSVSELSHVDFPLAFDLRFSSESIAGPNTTFPTTMPNEGYERTNI